MNGLVELDDRQKRRFRESISDDMKKASTLRPHRVSKRAYEKAQAIDPKLNLQLMTWHEQHQFDPGRELFIAEHKATVSSLRDKCIEANDGDVILATLLHDLEIVWILRDEDDELTRLEYSSKRPASAYQEAQIVIWEGPELD